MALVHNIEGGHTLEGKLANLEALFQRGVAYMTLAHFFPNEIVFPTFPWPEHLQQFNWFQDERDLTRGLTPFGEAGGRADGRAGHADRHRPLHAAGAQAHL